MHLDVQTLSVVTVFITALVHEDVPRAPRTAVYTVANPETVPQAPVEPPGLAGKPLAS